jgi:hypothetical protein
VLGDAFLASLIYSRLRRAAGSVMVDPPFLARVAAAAAAGCIPLAIGGLPDLLAGMLAGVIFLGVGLLVRIFRPELRHALARG